MMAVVARVRDRWRTTLSVLRATRVRINLYGSADARAIQRNFTERHPRIPIFARKRWGVALLPLPETFAEYLAGGGRQAVRTNRRRATAAGYRYAAVRTQDYLDDILEVNASGPIRQGRPMGEEYTDRDTVARMAARHPASHGILDRAGRLRAYAITRDAGDAVVVSAILGHAAALDDGVMYLLVSEIVAATIAGRRADGSPRWLMYDTFWGAKPGLAYFKRRTGFEAYTVNWVWVPDRPIGAAAGEAPFAHG